MLTQIRLYNKLTGDRQFDEMEAALRDWLFGCNPWGTSMIVGLPQTGDYPVDAHAAISRFNIREPWGGLVDGPVYGSIYRSLRGIYLANPDEYADFQPNSVVYHDDFADYSTNEPTLDGTAGLTYYLAAMVPPSSIAEKPIALFSAGEAGYACFRIPAIVKTTKGTLLAFAEARKKGCSDTGDIDLVVRRSQDQGHTWDPIRVVWDAGNAVAGNPAPVVDRETGTIFLLSTWNLGADHESMIIDGTSADTRRIFVLNSTDDGQSWSGAREITGDVKQPGWTWYATGPVHGIQLEKKPYRGRLVIPCDHIESGTKKYYSHTIYSDDHGATWKLGGTTPQDQVNECTVAELADGKLILNMRNYDRKQKNRKISISSDGGESWSDIRDDRQLIEPICQAGLMSVWGKGKKESLYFLNPSDSLNRTNLTLKMSRDAGRNWVTLRVVHPGPSAYSDLVSIHPEAIGCLYEAGEQSPYEAIWFRIIGIQSPRP
jgi:sialidase-1